MANIGAHFRFLDLPAEIRKQVYKELLCNFTFEPACTGYHDSRLARLMDRHKEYCFKKATFNIDTSILLVNRKIYHEAHDVMIKTNQFIRVHAVNLDVSEVLPRYRAPIVVMDEQRTAQFKGYVLELTMQGRGISDASHGRQVPPAVNLDFLILGRHWTLFCEGLPYVSVVLKFQHFHLAFNATRLTRISNGTDQKGGFDRSFIQKTRKSLLEPLQTCLRGAEESCLVTVFDHELALSTTNVVTTQPWEDAAECLTHLESSIFVAKQAVDDGNPLEASGAFENILERLVLTDPAPNKKSPDLESRRNAIEHSCTLGVVQCCLLQWLIPPPLASEVWYYQLDSMITEELAKSSEAEQPKLRALHHLYKAQLHRLEWVEWSNAEIMSWASASEIAMILLKAEEEDTENEEIREEWRVILELSGLEGKTIRDVAALLS